MNREVVVYQRPICDMEYSIKDMDQFGRERWKRCRKTATVSIDGVWRCDEHKTDDFGIQWAAMSIPIRWVRE